VLAVLSVLAAVFLVSIVVGLSVVSVVADVVSVVVSVADVVSVVSVVLVEVSVVEVDCTATTLKQTAELYVYTSIRKDIQKIQLLEFSGFEFRFPFRNADPPLEKCQNSD